MTIRYGDRGDAVRGLQRALLTRDPDALPRFGVDGHLGAETWAALVALADDLRVDPLDAPPTRASRVYPELLDALLSPVGEPECSATCTPSAQDALLSPVGEPECSATCTPSAQDDVRVYDLRAERVASRPKVRLDARGRPVVRDMSRVTGVVIHQTAVPFSVGPAQLRAANGDRALALARRGLGVACHAIAFDGFGALTTPLAWHVNHGNGLNSRSLGIEIDGLYEGALGNPRTAWQQRPPTMWTRSRSRAARATLARLVAEARAAGCPLRYVWAHRQSSATRRSDPGEAIWRDVGEYARDALGLEWQPRLIVGTGAPIPAAWGGVGPY